MRNEKFDFAKNKNNHHFMRNHAQLTDRKLQQSFLSHSAVTIYLKKKVAGTF